MLYSNEKNRIFHIHIPRTAGKYIKNIFFENKFHGSYMYYNEYYKGIEVPHLHYPLYNHLPDVRKSDHFTVVRHPFERFKSAIQVIIKAKDYPMEVYDKLKDKDWLFSFLEHSRNYKHYHQNHFRRQIDFISPKAHVYRFEDGFGVEFIDWINDKFNIELERVHYDYEIFHKRSRLESLVNKAEIDPVVEDHIRDYYSGDYENLKY